MTHRCEHFGQQWESHPEPNSHDCDCPVGETHPAWEHER